MRDGRWEVMEEGGVKGRREIEEKDEDRKDGRREKRSGKIGRREPGAKEAVVEKRNEGRRSVGEQEKGVETNGSPATPPLPALRFHASLITSSSATTFQPISPLLIAFPCLVLTAFTTTFPSPLHYVSLFVPGGYIPTLETKQRETE